MDQCSIEQVTSRQESKLISGVMQQLGSKFLGLHNSVDSNLDRTIRLEIENSLDTDEMNWLFQHVRKVFGLSENHVSFDLEYKSDVLTVWAGSSVFLEEL